MKYGCNTRSKGCRHNSVSLIITQPTNALIVCHLFLNHFLEHFHCSYMWKCFKKWFKNKWHTISAFVGCV